MTSKSENCTLNHRSLVPSLGNPERGSVRGENQKGSANSLVIQNHNKPKTMLTLPMFSFSKLTPELGIIEAKRDVHRWGNATPTTQAFLAYLGCQDITQARRWAARLQRIGCDCLVRHATRMADAGFSVEIKIKGLSQSTLTWLMTQLDLEWQAIAA